MAIKYWIFSKFDHSTDLNPMLQGSIREHEGIEYDERLSVGDYVYLAPGWQCIAGWGTVMKKEKQFDENGVPRAYKVTIHRTVLNPSLVPQERIDQTSVLNKLFAGPKSNLSFLDVQQVEEINRLIGSNAPPNPSELDEESLYALRHRGRPKTELSFILNEKLAVKEGGFYEFKEIKGGNPVGSIVNVADEYAVAYLNGHGGTVLWGVRDHDRSILGVELSYGQQDDIRRNVTQKLTAIQPSVPIGDFFFDFHPIRDNAEDEIPDRYVVELDVPAGSATELYANASGNVWIQTQAGKAKLTWEQAKRELLARNGVRR